MRYIIIKPYDEIYSICIYMDKNIYFHYINMSIYIYKTESLHGSHQVGVRDKSFSKCLIIKQVRPIQNNAEKRTSLNL